MRARLAALSPLAPAVRRARSLTPSVTSYGAYDTQEVQLSVHGYDEVLGDTLALVNVARQAFGKPPLTDLPDAVTGNPADCLYYRGLADIGVTEVGADHMCFASDRTAAFVASIWGVERNGNRVTHPKQVSSVIGSFDGHQLSRYEV